MKYKISEYAKLNKVTYRTVWAWVKSGKVQSELITTGRILIVDNELCQNLWTKTNQTQNRTTY